MERHATRSLTCTTQNCEGTQNREVWETAKHWRRRRRQEDWTMWSPKRGREQTAGRQECGVSPVWSLVNSHGFWVETSAPQQREMWTTGETVRSSRGSALSLQLLCTSKTIVKNCVLLRSTVWELQTSRGDAEYSVGNTVNSTGTAMYGARRVPGLWEDHSVKCLITQPLCCTPAINIK